MSVLMYVHLIIHLNINVLKMEKNNNDHNVHLIVQYIKLTSK